MIPAQFPGDAVDNELGGKVIMEAFAGRIGYAPCATLTAELGIPMLAKLCVCVCVC